MWGYLGAREKGSQPKQVSTLRLSTSNFFFLLHPTGAACGAVLAAAWLFGKSAPHWAENGFQAD